MSDFLNKNIYPDTNALRSLAVKTEISLLLLASQDEKIRLFVSEVVLYERGRQFYQEKMEGGYFPAGVVLDEQNKEIYLKGILNSLKKVFQDHKAEILEYLPVYDDLISSLFETPESYFKHENKNDHRDAIILISATENLDPSSTIIVCHEKNLEGEFKNRHFFVHNDAKNFIKEIREELYETSPIPNLEKILSQNLINSISQESNFGFSEHFVGSLNTLDPNYAHLIPIQETSTLTKEGPSVSELEKVLNDKLVAVSEVDKAIRIKILGFAEGFLPITKDELLELVTLPNCEDEKILNNAGRLVLEGLIQDTGNHFLPQKDTEEKKQIFEAALQEVLPEILNQL